MTTRWELVAGSEGEESHRRDGAVVAARRRAALVAAVAGLAPVPHFLVVVSMLPDHPPGRAHSNGTGHLFRGLRGRLSGLLGPRRELAVEVGGGDAAVDEEVAAGDERRRRGP